MKLLEIGRLLNAEVLLGQAQLPSTEIMTICGSDLMSDVLAYTQYHSLLLTGLNNVQVIRTAEISGLAGVVFVRGRRPAPEVLRLAAEKNLPVLLTNLPMFEACGLLYRAGLMGCPSDRKDGSPHV